MTHFVSPGVPLDAPVSWSTFHQAQSIRTGTEVPVETSVNLLTQQDRHDIKNFTQNFVVNFATNMQFIRYTVRGNCMGDFGCRVK